MKIPASSPKKFPEVKKIPIIVFFFFLQEIFISATKKKLITKIKYTCKYNINIISLNISKIEERKKILESPKISKKSKSLPLSLTLFKTVKKTCFQGLIPTIGIPEMIAGNGMIIISN